MKSLVLQIVSFIMCSVFAEAQPTPTNSNYWPVHKDPESMFRISYPTDWVMIPPKGPNVVFSVSPTDGPGNCNVVKKKNRELINLSQSDLNEGIASLNQDALSWSNYLGVPAANIQVVESKIVHIGAVSGLLGILVTKMENVSGAYYRHQIVVLFMRPGIIWTINCGASSYSQKTSKERFDLHRVNFSKVIDSFIFLN